jgi:hypothetical protein
MEAFEAFVALALEEDGFIVSSSVKFRVRRRTRRASYEEVQEHGYEVDLVASRAEQLVLATVKSAFGSRGVVAEAVTGETTDRRQAGRHRFRAGRAARASTDDRHTLAYVRIAKPPSARSWPAMLVRVSGSSSRVGRLEGREVRPPADAIEVNHALSRSPSRTQRSRRWGSGVVTTTGGRTPAGLGGVFDAHRRGGAPAPGARAGRRARSKEARAGSWRSPQPRSSTAAGSEGR